MVPTDNENIHQRMHKVCRKMLVVLDYWNERGWTGRMKVPADKVRECMNSTIQGEEMPWLDREPGDYKAQSGPSEARKVLFSQKIVTRTSLAKKCNPNHNQLAKMKSELQLDGDTPTGEVFNVVMQKQSDVRDVMWEDNEPGRCRDQPPDREGVKVEPIAELIWHERKVRIGELCGGHASFMKGDKASGGAEVVVIAEHNPRHESNNRKQFPEADLLQSNEQLTTKYMDETRLEGITGGMPRQEHSKGSSHRTGNTSTSGSGKDYQEAPIAMSAAYGGLGLPFGIFECGTGVLKPAPGEEYSPYKRVLQNAQSYYDARGGETTLAYEVKSPLTQCTAPVNHERASTLLLNTKCFPAGWRAELPQGNDVGNWGGLIDHTLETQGRFVMPSSDMEDFVTEFKKTKTAYVDHILNPPAGHGEGALLSIESDPKQGIALTFIGGGGKWILVEFNDRPVLAPVNNAEKARAYYLRGLQQAWLDPHSEFGRMAISHAVVQTVAHAYMVWVLLKYTQLMTQEESESFGYNHRVSPQDMFHHKAFGTVPSAQPNVKVHKRSQERSDAELYAAKAGGTRRECC